MKSTTASKDANMTATAVYIIDDVDYDTYLDDEAQIFHVYVGDDDAEPVGKTYTVRRGRAAAISLGEKIARDRRLELVID
jgi:hypothetical protein